MENKIKQNLVAPQFADRCYQEAVQRIAAPKVFVIRQPLEAPIYTDMPSKSMLFMVLVAHAVAIYFLTQTALIAPSKTAPIKPMLVSLIALPAPKPELVPIVEPPKPMVQQKPILKKVVETIKPIEMPSERLIEATTQQAQEDTPLAPAQVQDVAEAEAPPKAEPVFEEKIEPPKFGVAYLNNPTPNYPSLSRRNGEEGRALLRVLVSEHGTATEVELEKSSGSERLDNAAIEAVKNWRFIPARKGSQVLSSYVLVPIKFSLNS